MNKSQFFKHIENGGGIKLITFHGEAVPDSHRMAGVRRAIKVQSNGVKFEGDSWLYKSDVDAKDVTEVFAGCELPAVSVGWAIYQLVK